MEELVTKWVTLKDGRKIPINPSSKNLQSRLKKQLGKNKNSNNFNKINKKYVEKINKNDIPKKIKEYENNIRGKEIEYSYVIEENGEVYLYKGNKDSVNIKASKNAIITHNHTLDGNIYRSFGEDDYNFLKNNDIKELRLANPDYNYFIKKVKNLKEISYNSIYKEAMLKYNGNSDFEIHHEAMLILKEKGYVEYEKTRI